MAVILSKSHVLTNAPFLKAQTNYPGLRRKLVRVMIAIITEEVNVNIDDGPG